MSVYLTQCLCPKRHAIIATATEDKEQGEQNCRDSIRTMLNCQIIDPWCGICYAPPSEWAYETREIPGKTLEEVMPLLKESEAEQRLTAEHMKHVRAKAEAN
jgi:hypothetical protein